MSEVTEELLGMRAVYGQPIEERINEMVAGIKSDLGIKIFDPDLEVLKQMAAEVVEVIEKIPVGTPAAMFTPRDGAASAASPRGPRRPGNRSA
jgi:Cu/Ag efflux pump CusA